MPSPLPEHASPASHMTTPSFPSCFTLNVTLWMRPYLYNLYKITSLSLPTNTPTLLHFFPLLYSSVSDVLIYILPGFHIKIYISWERAVLLSALCISPFLILQRYLAQSRGSVKYLLHELKWPRAWDSLASFPMLKTGLLSSASCGSLSGQSFALSHRVSVLGSQVFVFLIPILYIGHL